MKPIPVYGGGPAGASAAIELRRLGLPVEIFERAKFPRHRVCGEYLSGECALVLQKLGVWEQFLALAPSRFETLTIHLGKHKAEGRLPTPAYGLSRYSLDALLLAEARRLGAAIRQETGPREPTGPGIVAYGRRSSAPRGNRWFGFKAHYLAPRPPEGVHLYFFDGAYTGVSTVENGALNVCGLAPEPLLRRFAFDYDALLGSHAPLWNSLRGAHRTMDWLTTGPVVLTSRLPSMGEANPYPAGDSLLFVDPFTGSGLLSSMTMGILAARAAAARAAAPAYRDAIAGLIGRPLRAARLFRFLLRTNLAGPLLPLAPLPWLIAATRPRVAAALAYRF